MRIQRKLLIGFLTLASIFSGTLAYRTQMPANMKTDLEISKDAADEDTVLEDTSLSEPVTDSEPISQTPDKTEENKTSETENTELPPANTKDNTVSESTKNQNTPAQSTSIDSTPAKDIPADKNTSKDKAPAENTPIDKSPVENTPAYNAPEPTPNTEETQTAGSSPVDTQTNNNSVDTSKKTTITYEELEKFIRSGNSVTENSPPASSTTPPAAPEASTPSPSNNSNYANQVLSILNQERASAGLPPLTMNQSAVNAASVRAKEIVSSFSHTRPSGQSPFTALDEAGVSYRAAGENIACGQKSPSEVMTGWMNSSGHRANILNSSFTQVGIACYEDPNSQYGYYWVQLFIG